MKRRPRIPRVAPLLISLALALPPPAFALRIRNAGLEEPTPTLEEIEDRLRVHQPSRTSLEEWMDEPQLGKNNAYARSLKKLLLGSEVTQHSTRRLRVLKRIGPELEAYTRSLLRNPRINSAIFPLGSTIRGSAYLHSDVDAAVYILDGIDPTLLALKESLGYKILSKLNDLLEREGFPIDKIATGFGSGDVLNLSHFVRYKAARSSPLADERLAILFLPVAYGDGERLEQIRGYALSNLGNQKRSRWQSIRLRHRGLIGLYWPDAPDEILYDVSRKPHLRRWLSRQGVVVTSERSVETFDRKRYRRIGLPPLSTMLRIYRIPPRPPTAGLEEAGRTSLAVERGWQASRFRRVVIQEQVETMLRDLTRLGFTTQILDLSLVKRYPQLGVLAELSGGTIRVDRSETLDETRQFVVELVARDVRRVHHYGESERGQRFRTAARRALIHVETPRLTKPRPLLAKVLANLSGLPPKTVAERYKPSRLATWLDRLA